MSKGSNRRPSAIPAEDFATNYERTFAKRLPWWAENGAEWMDIIDNTPRAEASSADALTNEDAK